MCVVGWTVLVFLGKRLPPVPPLSSFLKADVALPTLTAYPGSKPHRMVVVGKQRTRQEASSSPGVRSVAYNSLTINALVPVPCSLVPGTRAQGTCPVPPLGHLPSKHSLCCKTNSGNAQATRTPPPGDANSIAIEALRAPLKAPSQPISEICSPCSLQPQSRAPCCAVLGTRCGTCGGRLTGPSPAFDGLGVNTAHTAGMVAASPVHGATAAG